jgi:hypothetical protein
MRRGRNFDEAEEALIGSSGIHNRNCLVPESPVGKLREVLEDRADLEETYDEWDTRVFSPRLK